MCSHGKILVFYIADLLNVQILNVCKRGSTEAEVTVLANNSTTVHLNGILNTPMERSCIVTL